MSELQSNTQETITIFPNQIGWGLIIGIALIGVFGAAMMVVTWSEQEWIIIAMCAALGAFGLGFALLLIRKRRKGISNPTLMLSPSGLHLMAGATGVIPWNMIQSLGHLSVKGQHALVLNVEKSAIDVLNQSAAVKTSRKIDAAIGINGITFFQQHLQLPIEVVAELLHQYSVAHGGLPLVADQQHHSSS
ncbi:STM3941 family protein [Parasulfitobacter algicola]|uniref:Uncharacterized protein n=1 Tax=Parasulfitobacter algicola TaxID=2614809 RepID=A0ABX2IXZ4_9RHOB|nr:STM3941 family protein [Sulfitobacter algicola]NSX55058.1 hypothetical protein [Sulfitobacter algicola]